MRLDRTDSDQGEILAEEGYDYVKEIARGGYGRVCLLRRVQGNGMQSEYVAGKFIYRDIFGLPGDTNGEAAYQRAIDGLRNFRSLSGEAQYLLRIFDVREHHDEGYFCYMMELADDLNLGRRVDPNVYKPRTLKGEIERNGRRQRLPAKDCVEIAVALGRGLQILHEGGFTHRDVRPSNIIFVNDLPKLADIDLLAGHDLALTSYIPKHYAAREGSHSIQGDIFSFGKTLYEMCTGLSVKDYPCLPPEVRYWDDHQLLLKVNKIVIKACGHHPRKRYASTQEMLNELECI
jgi:serine/threonine protein kinase